MGKIRAFALVCAFALLALAWPIRESVAQTAAPAPRALVVYDAVSGSEFEKLGFAYAIMLRNLLGHFDANVEMIPAQSYVAGKMANFDATFYLGSHYDAPLPAAFLADASSSAKTVVWFKYNIWRLAWDPAYNFQQSKGLGFSGLRGLNAAPSSGNPTPGFFDTVAYKGKSFVKYYAFNASTGLAATDPDVGAMAVTDAGKARALVTVTNPKTGEALPYVARSGNFWYVADVPLSFIGPRDRYLVLADLLHDMLGVSHPESHKALARLEDVGALVSVSAMRQLTDYLSSKSVPFSIATIPYYIDPLGLYNGGIEQRIPLSQASNLKRALNYAMPRGAEIVMHGYTHQYARMKNPWTGVSGDDYEFWNIVANAPVAEDSFAWAGDRLRSGLADLNAFGYRPVAWEAPHYHASASASRAAASLFGSTYQRVVYFTADKPSFASAPGKDFAVGQIFPYVVGKDHYGQRVIPESLGNIEYDIHLIDPSSTYNYTWQDIVENARYGLAVRDGYASFFFHPFWLEPELGLPGFADFKATVEGISALGYSWVAPSQAR